MQTQFPPSTSMAQERKSDAKNIAGCSLQTHTGRWLVAKPSAPWLPIGAIEKIHLEPAMSIQTQAATVLSCNEANSDLAKLKVTSSI